MRSTQVKGLLWLGSGLVLGVLLAFGLPYFSKWLPLTSENYLAEPLAVSFDREGCRGHEDAEKILDKLVRRLYPFYPEDQKNVLKLQVIHGSTVNAFAFLGGRIYVFDGLLQQAESPEELAGVLAHEIEHIRQRHVIQGIVANLISFGGLQLIFSGSPGSEPEALLKLLNLRFSREQEAAADEGGVLRLVDTEIDVSGFQHFFERMEKEGPSLGLLSDHPDDKERASLVRKYLGLKSRPVLLPEEWLILKKVCL